MSDYFSPEKSSKWENEIASLLGKDILDGASMKRLRGVSFLGILNVAAGVPESRRFTRYDHSISVAYLTWLFCQNLRIREEISLTATLAALIHDVTHPPFSHSTEVYLQIRSGYETKHTSGLTKQKINRIVTEGYSSLPRPLQREPPKILADRLYDLLNFKERRKTIHPYLANVIETPFCPDTFDGINRAWSTLNVREVKHRLSTENINVIDSIDPISLVRFISSTTTFPFIYRSESSPSKSNLIYKFHDSMRALYNNVIYSDWQLSVMVMFARTLEIAFQDAERFELAQNDTDVIKKIEANSASSKLYKLIADGHSFYTLSRENPYLYKKSLVYYADAKKQRISYKDMKKTIEATIASELKVDSKNVFWYKYRPLIWSSGNIRFEQLASDKSLWFLRWEPSEGEPSAEFEFETYYTTSI